jgi:hypothetical protein
VRGLVCGNFHRGELLKNSNIFKLVHWILKPKMRRHSHHGVWII